MAPFFYVEAFGLYLGPLLFLIVLMMPASQSFTPAMRAVAASTCWIAAWWVMEAVPIPVTALLPLILYPLTGALTFAQTATSYSDANIFLFLGGFMIAAAMQRWDLHRRMALGIVSVVGTRPEMLILGFMVATGFLSMWISNTATAMMMLPIGLAVISQLAGLAQKEGLNVDVSPNRFGYGQVLMLAIAYSATIGGVATLIGTPPNAILAGAVSAIYGIEIGFADWMSYGLPISIIFMVIAWAYLTRSPAVKQLKGLKGGKDVVAKELRELGPLSKSELKVLVVFVLVVVSWITRGFLISRWLPQVNDAMISVMGAFVLFVLPVDLKKREFVLDWETAVKIPWGILLLFGGGISIAAGFTHSGLASWMGEQLAVLANAPMILVFLSVVTLVIFLTEVTSNTGTTSVMMPVMAALAMAMSVHPLGLMVTAATAASFAFMLPVATPPNAVVFGSGYLTIPQMAKAGVWLNIMGIILITLITYFWIPIAWGIDLSTFIPGF